MLEGGRVGRVDKIGGAVVARLRVVRLDRVDERAGLLGSIRPGQRRDEARALNLDLMREERAGGEGAKNGHEPSLGELAPLGL